MKGSFLTSVSYIDTTIEILSETRPHLMAKVIGIIMGLIIVITK